MGCGLWVAIFGLWVVTPSNGHGKNDESIDKSVRLNENAWLKLSRLQVLENDFWMDGWMDGWMNGWTYGWMIEWMGGCMDR